MEGLTIICEEFEDYQKPIEGPSGLLGGSGRSKKEPPTIGSVNGKPLKFVDVESLKANII